jgi:hypothetical protein
MESNNNNWDEMIAGAIEILCAVAIFVILALIH